MDNIAVVGFGKTGKALLDFIIKNWIGKTRYLYIDDKPDNQEEIEYYLEKGITFLLGEKNFKTLSRAELIILSPGVDGRTKRFRQLKDKGTRIISEIEFAYRFIKGKIIALTGTNGKSTTVSLIHHLLTEAGIKSFLTGNIGEPLIAKVEETTNDSVVIIEASSFQLEEIEEFRPDIALILNITPDHLDRHKSMKNYVMAKIKIVKNQQPQDILILNYRDRYLRKNCQNLGRSRKVWFNLDENNPAEGIYVNGKNARINLGNKHFHLSLKGNRLLGVHNLENVTAAVLAAKIMEAKTHALETGLATFKGLEHRMESLGKIGEVEYINDSKATNPDATIKSIKSIKNNLIVILGGKDKGGDFLLLLKWLKDKRVKKILLIGDAAPVIQDNLILLKKKTVVIKDLKEAVITGYQILKNEGGVVLLAPGCASFDMFKNFEHRGQVFKEEFNSALGEINIHG